MAEVIPIPDPGQIVQVRQRRYLVEEVVAPPAADDATVLRLSCLDDDAQGQPLQVLWEREVDPRIVTGGDWHDLAKRGFDPPKLFSSYLHTLRWNCVTATNPKLFQAPYRAGIKIDAYQVEPLRKALLLPRVNLFIADDVGLGKTIEAGLIARELLLRKKVKDIVVACPPSMLLQWQEELENRFGLTFVVLDKDYVLHVRRERGYGVNPWTTHSRFLVSHRLLIDETYAGPLRNWLSDFRAASLLILDEAHHAAPSSGSRYAIDSKITRAVRDVAPRFEHRLFLSATPHNGHSNSFSALLEILDPQRFCRGVPVRGKKILEDVMVRRLKEDVRKVQGGFPERTTPEIDIDGLPPDTPELRLSELLDQYRQLREERLKDESKTKQAAAGLLISGLQQRLLSSVEAFARTLRVHQKTVQRQMEAAAAGTKEVASVPGLYDLVGESVGSDDERATLPEKELQDEEEAQIEAVTQATSGPTQAAIAKQLFAKEQQLLKEMSEIAERSRSLPDARIRKLVDWIRAKMCPDLPPLGQTAKAGRSPKWNDIRVIIFTEYEDTQRYLSQHLGAAISETDRAAERIEVFHGPTPPAKRKVIKRAFNTDPKKHPLRILIATDAAREGLNLQLYCHNLFHFDVPWNPSRMEQRNGRIDRKLQPSPTVYCHYFVYKQRVEDRILAVLVRKTETIKKELGCLAQVIEGRLASTMSKGIRHADADRLAREIDRADLNAEDKKTVQEELEEARERQDDLKERNQTLRDLLDESKKWTGLKEDHFQSAISCALEMLGADPLKPVAASEAIRRCQFPALDQREGADATWAETMDALRVPRKPDQSFWEWRRESPIRPVVFEDTGTMDEDVVHLHLEHRVVQRLLSRFTAQGFVYHDLARACLSQTADPIPRVILLGRLCLYGMGAARLHEELIWVTARWAEVSARKGPLKPYAREAELKTIDLLEEALLPRGSKRVASEVQKNLLTSAAQDVQDLLPYLMERGKELCQEAIGKLAERGKKEAKEMRTILEEQKQRVTATIAKYKDVHQPGLFPEVEEEKRQLEANKRHWHKRLESIEQELEKEPARIRDVYTVKAQRIEPVGLVYLWPATN